MRDKTIGEAMTTDTQSQQLTSIESRLDVLESRAKSKDSIDGQQAVLRASIALLIVLGGIYLVSSGANIPGNVTDLALAILTMFMLGDAGFKLAASRQRNNNK